MRDIAERGRQPASKPAANWLVVNRPEQLSDYPREVGSPERRHQANLIRDIFGNPFRPVAFDSAWRTSTAVAVAEGIYESRDFSPMPILADALQDAGCDSDDVLDHCRDRTNPRSRVLGRRLCWAGRARTAPRCEGTRCVPCKAAGGVEAALAADDAPQHADRDV